MPTPTERGLVPAAAQEHTGAPVRVGSHAHLTLSGVAHESLDWFARTAALLHGLRVESAVEDADVLISTEADASEFASVAPATGVDPRPEPGADERHSLTVTEGRVLIRSTNAEGAFRALSGLLQLLTVDRTGNVWAPVGTVVDGPRYIWRGLSLDVVRHFFTLDEVRRVIDLLALYKFNVLHLHLTDNEGWRLESRAYPELTRTRSDGTRTHYTREEFADLVAHAARRYITVVPEVDLPGHTHAAFDARPELAGDIVHPHPWLRHLHPDSAPARRFAREVIAEFAAATPGPFLHLGGDEPFGMDRNDYVAFVGLTHRWVREQGKRVVGWQETARAGVLDGDDLLQYWIGAPEEFDPEAIKRDVPERFHPLVDQAAETFRISPGDVPAATAAGVPVLVSPNSRLYLDRPYADACADPGQEAARARLGLPGYAPITVADTFDWEPSEEVAPGTVVAGVEAAVWGETVTGFGDLAFLLLPRLPGVAEKAWTPFRTTWAGHRGRLAGHETLWEALGFVNHFRPVATVRNH